MYEKIKKMNNILTKKDHLKDCPLRSVFMFMSKIIVRFSESISWSLWKLNRKFINATFFIRIYSKIFLKKEIIILKNTREEKIFSLK